MGETGISIKKCLCKLTATDIIASINVHILPNKLYMKREWNMSQNATAAKSKKNQKAPSKGGFADFPVKKKLFLTHGTIALMAIILAIGALVGVWRMTAYFQKFHDGPMIELKAVSDLRYATSSLESAILSATQSGGLSYDQFNAEAGAYGLMITEAVTTLRGNITDTEAIAILDKLDQAFASCNASLYDMTDFLRQGSRYAAKNIYDTNCNNYGYCRRILN